MKPLHCAAVLAASFASLAMSTPASFAQVLPTALPAVPYQNQLDPQMLTVLQAYELISGVPITGLAARDARQQFSPQDAAKAVARSTGKQEAPQRVGYGEEQQIPGPDGTAIPIRVYTPAGTGPFPVVLYFHGGGFVIATNDTYDASIRALSNQANAIVVAVEYRKAPQYPYPAAFNDATTAYDWLLHNAASINGNANKIAVAGESAGGNLATDICLYARNNGIKLPVYQLLVYPVVSSSLAFPSVTTYANAVPLSKAGLMYFFGKYVTPGTDVMGQYISPLDTDLHGLPPATVISAQIDPLQSEGAQYAAKLSSSGVKTNYLLFTGVTHEFFGMGAVVDKALSAEQQAGADLRAAFAK